VLPGGWTPAPLVVVLAGGDHLRIQQPPVQAPPLRAALIVPDRGDIGDQDVVVQQRVTQTGVEVPTESFASV
jgi:hypothetical protein